MNFSPVISIIWHTLVALFGSKTNIKQDNAHLHRSMFRADGPVPV